MKQSTSNNVLITVGRCRQSIWMTIAIYIGLLLQLGNVASSTHPSWISSTSTYRYGRIFEHLRGGADEIVSPIHITDEDRVRSLARQYSIEPTRIQQNEQPSSKEEIQPILDGSLKDALHTAKSQARLLVVLIPSSKGNADDKMAMRSFLSLETALIAEKKPFKSKKMSTLPKKHGSFLLWTASPGSMEATTAIKRIGKQVQYSKHKPFLVVLYPATVMDAGQWITVPKVLAQHHCSPPPDPPKMSGWLNELRKRHVKEYVKLQKLLQEQQIQIERIQGYRGSVRDDQQQREREEQERRAREEQERIEQERIQAIRIRRQQLRDSLPIEPTTDGIPVALRFADGRTGRRSFGAETSLSQIFNWVDGYFDMERENVILTTLKGKQQFEWNDNDDDEDGEALPTLKTFGKMIAFRVTLKKKDESSEEKSIEEL